MSRRQANPSSRSLSIDFQPEVHLIDQMEELNRIEVEDRLCLSLKAIKGKITGHHQKAGQADPVERAEDGLDLISILIFAGEVDKGIYPEAGYLEAEHIGREGRMTSRIIGDRKAVDKLPLSDLFCKTQDFILSLTSRTPPRNELKSIDKLLLCQESFPESFFLHWYS